MLATSVSVRDARNSPQDREWIRGVYRDYLFELSSSQTGLFPVLGDWAARENEFMAGWFADAAAHPFVILHDARRVGFALVTRPSGWERRTPGHRMTEFFIVEAARRRGVGAGAAALLFQRFAGEWEVHEDAHDERALRFWRQVISRHTGGRYSESRSGGEVRHRFTIDARP